jgi:hypothetical protein
MEDMRSTYNILVGKPQGNIPNGRHKCKWKGNIKNLFKSTIVLGCEVCSVGSGQGPVCYEYRNENFVPIKCLEFCEQLSKT